MWFASDGALMETDGVNIATVVPSPHKPWSDAEVERLADALIRRQQRLVLDAQDAERKKAKAREKRERMPAIETLNFTKETGS